MESKRINWKRILKSMIASIGFTLACLLIGSFAFMPLSKVNAAEWSLSSIKENNIHFVAAKTKVKNASSYTYKVDNPETSDKNEGFIDKNGNNFSTFTYDYNESETVKYYSTTNSNDKLDKYSASSGNVQLNAIGSPLKTFDEITTDPSKQKTYIPSNAEYFYNTTTNSYDNVFYDDIGENDFVMLDNYNSHQNITYTCPTHGIISNENVTAGKCSIDSCGKDVTNSFNVENIYLSFGAPVTYNKSNETPDFKPIVISSVSGWLYTETETHNLILNKPISYEFIEPDGEDKNNGHYWYQYLDLRNLMAKNGAREYNIKDQQGKYVFTFEFAVFDDNFEVEEEANDSFTFSFYLLDSMIYDSYPEITTNGSNPDYIAQNKIREFYYNYNKDNPTLTYDPTKFNLSYTRENREIVDTTTTSLTRNAYTNGPKTDCQVDVITFKTDTVINGDTNNITTSYKNLYILKHENINTLEYLYLSDNNATPLATGLNFEDDPLIDTDNDNYTYKVKNGDLNFEYKISKVLTKVDETYTIKTYKSYSENCRAWGVYETNLIHENIYNKDDYTSQDINKNYNVNDLEYMLDPSIIPNDYNYSIEFDKLGLYTFNYAYAVNVQEITNGVTPDTAGADYRTTNVINEVRPANSDASDTKVYSSKLLTPAIYGLEYVQDQNEKQIASGKIKLSSWANLTKATDSDTYSATINGIKYDYTPANTTITNKTTNDTIILVDKYADNKTTNIDLDGDPLTNGVNDIAKISTAYRITDTLSTGNIKLEIVYTIGDYSKSEKTITWTNTDNQIVNSKKNVYENYKLNAEAQKIIKSTYLKENEHWSNIWSLLDYMYDAGNLDESNIYAKTYTSSTSNLEISTPTMNTDKLHMFGSMAYFNKEDPNTDTGYAELRLVDKNTDVNFVSDVTRYVANPENAKAGFSESIENLENMIITTDMASVFWRNYSTLLYEGKISKSYIYKYDSYSWKNGKVELGAVDTDFSSLYTKDMRIGVEDGLYEVIVCYNYDDYKSTDLNYDPSKPKTFYQLFTFIISRKTPSVSVKLYNEDKKAYIDDFSSINSKKYTNKDVEISWAKPTYFQYDIFVKIDKDLFDTSNDYDVKYSQGKFYTYNSETKDYTTEKDMSSYITDATEEDDPYYRLRIIGDHESTNIMGRYKTTIYCGPNQAPATSKNFIVDKEQISGTKIIPIVQNMDGTYKTTIDSENLKNYSTPSQIVNYDFTFRYNRKNSEAAIKTYWYEINLTQASKYDELLKINTKEAVTTNFEVNGTNLTAIQSRNPYNYNYDSDTFVASNNTFAGINSAIYLFVMEDEAGNTCRYVVFYDTTTPRFILDPSLNNTHNIINETTKLTWGDYKAIAISKPNDIGFDTNITIDNYTAKDKDGNKVTLNRLQEAICYINSNSSELFEDTRLQLIDGKFYLLLPITEVTIKDINANPYAVDTTNDNKVLSNSVTYTTNTTMPNDFYFIASSNPISTKDDKKYIELTNKNLVEINDDPEYTRVQLTKDNEFINRFIHATTDKDEIYGTISKGEFNFYIYDKQGNVTTGYLWMNLDKTQTLAYGLFNTKDTEVSSKNAVDLTGEDGSYSASRLFISSLEPSKSVPKYELTYKYYQYNPGFYEDLSKNYAISSVKIINKDSDAKDNPENIEIKGLEQYLVLTYLKNKVDENEPDSYTYIYIQITDEIGGEAPNHSYPYDMNGTAIISNGTGPEHIYDNNKSSYTLQEGTKTDPQTRIFSSCIYEVSDGTNYVTQEGLYIFKRSYVKNGDKYITIDPVTGEPIYTDDIGEDQDIIYLIYYVDRSGIINVTSMNSIAETLYENSAKNLGFILGSNYDDKSLKKYVDPNSINNKLKPYSTTTSNSNTHSVHNMNSTNKVKVEFNLMADKYNFNSFIQAFYKDIDKDHDSDKIRIYDVIGSNVSLQKYVETYLFNKNYYANNLYKLDLTLKVGNQDIINESEFEINPNNVYNTLAASQYLDGSYKSEKAETFNQRLQSLTLYKGTTNENYYSAIIKDSSGYAVKDGAQIVSYNNLANQLDITFNILHTTPTGEFYGKNYGEDNYDETNSKWSIPYDDILYDDSVDGESRYRLLTKYLSEGKLKLDPLTSIKNNSYNNKSEENVATLYSTNNETLVFTFAITPDEYSAQIDPSKLTIYKDDDKIFDVNGYKTTNGKVEFNFNSADSVISDSRMKSSYIWNKVDGIMYFAVIIFDNNLDTILDSKDKEEFKDFRLLDPLPKGVTSGAIYNTDNATYTIKLNYIGDKENYKDDKNVYYDSTTYKITVDREKPTYNLAKLMSLDKYKYNPAKVDVSTITNYETAKNAFDSYTKYYNFKLDENYDIYRSDLEKYFFAVDYRQGSSFSFESIDDLDNNNGIYIRKINDVSNYLFSRTQDDYLAYYESENVETTDLIDYPQFSVINAQTVQSGFDYSIDENYYYIPLDLFGKTSLSMQDLVNNKLLENNCSYEIIEMDEAGNSRVYGIYVPDYTANRLEYTYKLNTDSIDISGAINHDDNAYIEINGISFKIKDFKTTDKFLKASITITADSLVETKHIYYDPIDKRIIVTDGNNVEAYPPINNIPSTTEDAENKGKKDYTNTKEFIAEINKIIENYNTIVKDKNGYHLSIEIVDRIGLYSTISTTTALSNYVFEYNVAGEELTPDIQNFEEDGYFTFKTPEKSGTTNIVKVRAYIFKNGWTPKDPDDGARFGQSSKTFYKSEKELLDGELYYLAKGVYKFELTDNFNRTKIIFHELVGVSSIEASGTVRFSGNSAKYTDGYTYSKDAIEFVYDSNTYNIYIGYIGESTDGNIYSNETKPELIYSTENPTNDLSLYKMSISSLDGLTTITMSGVNSLSKYYIKTINAKIVASLGKYNWDDELKNPDIHVYDHKLAIYDQIQTPVVKNMNGIELDTSTQLNLTEDFEVSLKWNSNIPYDKRIDFDTKIKLIRSYIDENNILRKEEFTGENKYIITKHGDYTAIAYNSLGVESDEVSFTRGDGEISMYNVVNVHKIDNKYINKQSLKPSTIVNKEAATENETREIIIFNYFTTEDYFSFTNGEGVAIELADLSEEIANIDEVRINKDSTKYLDILVNSNLSILIQIYSMGIDGISNVPFVQFRIYSSLDNGTNNEDNPDAIESTYTYRFLKVYFLPNTNYSIVNTNITTLINDKDNLYNGGFKIKRPDDYLKVSFEPTNYVIGNTIYISRYYNNELIETTSHNSSFAYETILHGVGLHTFVIKDLAGRTQVFGNGTDSNTSLQVYLINQIIFTVNGKQPINKQYFNGEVNLKIQSEISSIPLYGTETLGITGTRDGIPLDLNNTGELKFTEPGYYVIKMVTTTKLSEGTSHVADQEISSIYSFTIVREDIAKRSFTVSNGDGFAIEKIIKVVNGQKTDVTNNYKSEDSLLLLTHEKEGNSKFIVTLKSYDDTIKDYRSFTFNVWINNETPVVRSNILAGTKTKDTIEINFNPGKIYEQVGKSYIRLNNMVYLTIDENSEDIVQTISISEKGEYYLEIVSEDGRVFSSYKYEKQNPINNTTKIVLICLGIGAILLVVAFFLIRRKGKYR